MTDSPRADRAPSRRTAAARASTSPHRPAAATARPDRAGAATLAATVVRRRRVRRIAGATAFAGALVVHALAFEAPWRDALAALSPLPPLLTATLVAAALAGLAPRVAHRRAARRPPAPVDAAVAMARALERDSVLWPLWGATALGPLVLALPTAGAGFDRLVTGVWSTAVAAHVALLLMSWTTSERLARASDRTLASPLEASGAVTWTLVAIAVVALGQALGRPVTVLGVGLAAFAGLSYLACCRLAAEREALRRCQL